MGRLGYSSPTTTVIRVFHEIIHKLDALLEGQKALMQTQAQLDATIANLTSTLATVVPAVQAAFSDLIAKAQAVAPATDFTPEVNALNAAIQPLASLGTLAATDDPGPGAPTT